jgi:acyl-CoA reductase-like NAD-dependent aldehyde dehydrogenase
MYDNLLENVPTDLWIGGKWRQSSDKQRFDVIDPATESKIASVASATVEDAKAAVDAASAAFPGWAGKKPRERAEILRKAFDLIVKDAERFAKLITIENGKALSDARGEVLYAAEFFRWNAEEAVRNIGQVSQAPASGARILVQHKPAGVAVLVTPWNFPAAMATRKIGPALAAGCTVVLKPPEWAPLSCSLLADLTEEAGIPPGVFNVVQGIGEEAGATLVANGRLRRVSFTGSSQTGQLVATFAARNLVPFTAELGGKSPLVVFADADLDAAAQKAALQYDDSGQNCMAGTRLLVEESAAGEFLERFHRSVDAHVLGDPREEATTISPLIHRDHLERVEGFVDRARANGDRIVRGGRVAEIGGLWYEPTLVEPRSNDSEIVQNEVFGPVLTFQTFSTEDEGVGLANSTRYGLAATVYTSSAERAERVGRSIRAGTVWVNCFLVRDLTAPFGGIGISGIGREGGDYALDFYSDLKTLQIREDSTR